MIQRESYCSRTHPYIHPYLNINLTRCSFFLLAYSSTITLFPFRMLHICTSGIYKRALFIFFANFLLYTSLAPWPLLAHSRCTRICIHNTPFWVIFSSFYLHCMHHKLQHFLEIFKRYKIIQNNAEMCIEGGWKGRLCSCYMCPARLMERDEEEGDEEGFWFVGTTAVCSPQL